ncbi:Diphosphoinositol polyphosphate phosphohydrolase 1 [Trichoplax sp. H2]|nr:Diphosphoinositol polyphosphate phosphohydrolase 1 [Trichoplax sp. H2]|eukprot:RDD41309.1 Diphosphoinositol polyphosphate phosphohydrolase 1 [Trichoplax sp. H2]
MVKTYYPDGFRKRAGCVCFRDDTEREILLVSSIKSPNSWTIPSGSVEPKEEFHQAAVREVVEEAGVKGVLGRCIGVFDYTEKKRRTTLYALLVTEMFDEWKDMDRGAMIKTSVSLLAIFATTF